MSNLVTLKSLETCLFSYLKEPGDMPVGGAPVLDVLLLRQVLHGSDGADHQPLCC